MQITIIILGVIILAALSLILIRLRKPGENKNFAEIDTLTQQIGELKSQVIRAEEKAKNLNETVNNQKAQILEKDNTILDLNRQLSKRDAEFTGIQEKLDKQKAEVDELQKKFREEFKNLANDILDEKTKKFTEQNKTNLDQILKPLGEKIREFQTKVEETYDKESKQRFSLEKEIVKLADLNQQISKDATNLTNALKGQSKTRGNWGEIILESILEKSGLVKDREYFVQPSYTNEHGKRLQPDIVLVYPGERNVIIDSKVSLNAYERYSSSEAKEEQEAAIKEHLSSIRNHISDLSGKNYQEIYQLKSLDFVMMFLPIEQAYFLAMQNDPNLWNFAYERRILLISPTNLIAALKMIANLWRVEYQNKYAKEIAEQGGALYDKFADFVKDLVDVGDKIDATKKVFDASMNKLTTGKGNLIRRAEKIKALGAKVGKDIPKSILERSEEENDLNPMTNDQ
ncbi:MAG: DNA recombination protein RmuC [Bacteroidetes bacterium]|nr:DNA recombination protein RmuC [Bacteroidota bacterium]